MYKTCLLKLYMYTIDNFCTRTKKMYTYMYKSLLSMYTYMYVIFPMYTYNGGNACTVLLYMYVYKQKNSDPVHVHVQRPALA